MRISALLTYAFFTVLAIEMYAAHTHNQTLVYIFKPLLMPLLMLLFFTSVTGNTKKERGAFMLGLVFSWAGDVFLMLNGFGFFISGVAAFLTAHIFYIISFSEKVKTALPRTKFKALIALPFIAYVIGYLYFLYPHITSKPNGAIMFGAIAVYGCVIGTMSCMAFMRRNAVSQSGFLLVFLGSLFFIASDSCLSAAMFAGKFNYSEIAIMLTYGWAQYLLTVGTISK